ncbi:hypothetical protein DQ657_22275 [Salmonella enterica]|nr:hypothetical protein [Salmonella enterica]
MTAGMVKKSPVIVVKKKRQIAPVTENVPAHAAQEREDILSTASESTVVSMQPQTHPSGLTNKQRKFLRHKQRQRQIRRDNIRNGRQKLSLFRQVFPLLWPEDNVFRLMKVGIFHDAEKFVNANFTSEGLTMNELAGLHSQISELSEYEQYLLAALLKKAAADGGIFCLPPGRPQNTDRLPPQRHHVTQNARYPRSGKKQLSLETCPSTTLNGR